MFPVAIFGLLYGDYPELHRRFIDGLQHVGNMRVNLWCNQVCASTLAYLKDKPYRLHVSEENVPKYKAMRQMFAQEIPEPWIVWFDDDTCITSGDWLARKQQFIAQRQHENICYIGQPLFCPHEPGQAEFIRQAKWFRGRPLYRNQQGTSGIAFALGGYWWLRTDVLRQLDWPDPRLSHNGGDTLLGEAIYQFGLPFHACDYGVTVNDAPRRGYDEAPAGIVPEVQSQTRPEIQPPAPISAGRIAMLTLYTPEIAAIGEISIHNKRSYCAQHGYDLLVEQATLDASRPAVWSKVLAILKHLPHYDWFFWSDPDSLVMNHQTRLESLCDQNVDLILTRDNHGMNAGQMLVRNTPAAREFFQRVYEQTQFVGHLLQEQAAMAFVLEKDATLKVRYCPQRSFNSYPSNYQTGDFIIHFAGTYNKLAGMKAFAQRDKAVVPPRDTAADLRLAMEHQKAGRLERADALYRQILEAEPNNAEALHRLGWLTYQQKYYRETIDLMGRAVQLRPSSAQWHNDLGAILFSHRQHADATIHFREAARLKPNHPTALTNLAVVLEQQGDLDGAIEAYGRAGQHRLLTARHFNDWAILLTKRYRFEEAIQACRQAIALESGSAEAYSNLAVALMELGRLEEAQAAFDRAVQLRPQDRDVRANRGIGLLMAGDFLRGWPEYACRWKSVDRDDQIARSGKPHWDGDDPQGKTILLYEEDGFGDVIQFARYVPMVVARGAKVILKCPPRLAPLLRTVQGVQAVVSRDQPTPDFDMHAPLIEMPIVFKTSLATVPAHVPYIQADPDLVSQWKTKLSGMGGFKIGVAWHADPKHPSWVRRSMPLISFEPLSRLPSVHLISLQKGPGSEQVNTVKFPIIDLGPDADTSAGAFMDTAAVMRCLDLVITVDTSIAHLAGALGAPVWLLLPCASEWRWMRNRSDSPWYPTMRLFRQSRWWDWQEVLERVVAELRSRLA